ncbi:hypothetical protein BGZ98_005291 [Dissophora globulifera]|nr:hypothetical protein BGZ98_005291 [Dissophora globulifera]
MVNDRSASAQMKKNNRAEEWLKNAVKDKHVRLIPFSEISKVKYNVAKGGSGTIHLGAWRNMHVAIKEQHNTNDLIKELKMHKQVHDSNYIVKFFGITKHPLTHDTCIVMQFAENGCLQDYLETQNDSITWLTKYRLAWEIASGLDFIHRENIFHTDLHSRNILIDTGGKALITDFGLSKSVNKTIYTTKAGLFGVVPYVAPERMQNPTITYNAKCDIYSLGVILWELSSCVIPFEAQLQDVMLAVNIIAGVREKTVPGTAVEYEMLYRRCWDGLPQSRPQMDIVLSELVELLASEQANPRSAAAQPTSPKLARPLSSGSMVAPSINFPYEPESALQPSPENTNHVRPISPAMLLRAPGVRQSFGQGMAPLIQQSAPSIPIRQDRSGVRVSFLGEPLVKDNQTSGHNRASGVTQGDASRNGHAKPAQIANQNNNNTAKAALTNNQANGTPQGHDSPVALGVTASGATAATAQDVNRPVDAKRQPQDRPSGSGESTASAKDLDRPAAPPAYATTDAGLLLLQPFPNTLPSKDGAGSATSTSVASSINKLPETAALALSNGISMVSVVSKLNMGSARNISTISPPPHGAPPPPPSAVAGHSNYPRVISPPAMNRPRTVSPPKTRNNHIPRASKTISPPSGPPPPGSRAWPSPNLGPIPKPPSGPPPAHAQSSTPTDKAPSIGTPTSTNTQQIRNPTAPVQYIPTTTYNPGKGKTVADKSKSTDGASDQQPSNSVSLSETTRPTPARQIPIGFPFVTPLNPPHWKKNPAPLATEQLPAASPSSSSPTSGGSSPTESPSSLNSTAPSSAGSSPTTNRRDFRPISFLTQHKHSGLIDLSTKGEQQLQEHPHQRPPQQHQQSETVRAENAYVPNPNNNIIPPSQLFMQRAESPDLHRHSRMIGSPSLRPAHSPTPDHMNNRMILSPHLAPSHNRPQSPAFALPPSSGSAPNGGTGLSIAEGSIWTPSKSASTEEIDGFVDVKSITDSREQHQRPQMHPSKESSLSTTATGTSLSSSPATTQVTGNSSLAASMAMGSHKPRVQLDNFYSLADPYKDLKQDEPTDFFTAVTHSDIPTVQRMLTAFPQLINGSNGFWPHPTPILVAARSRNAIETMKVLIASGADLDRGDHNGTTVLHFVCEQYPDPIEAIQFLTRAGADCNSRDTKKRTPLMVLLQNTHITVTKTLVDSMRCLFKFGAQTRVADHQFQRTPLHYAVMHSREPAPVMELLLKKGSDVNARDWRKSTPLHAILEKMDNEEIVQMLLLYGADPGLKNGNKRNALGVAAENLRVMSAWFLLENDLLSSAPDSIKKASELCSKAEGPDKSAKPLFKNTLSDWQGKDGKLRRIQLAQDCVLRVQRTSDMKTIDQTQVALEFLESVGQPIHMNMVSTGSNGHPTVGHLLPTAGNLTHR